MPEDHFGEPVAARYDQSSADMFEPAVVDPVVDVLTQLAGDGAALELGIGTGRIALPLSQRGVRVQGIDLSEAMVARLRAEPGAERIGVTVGDFAMTRVEGRFSVAYLVFNTIGNLTTQDQQIACFQNAAAGAAGTASRSPATAESTSQSGKRRVHPAPASRLSGSNNGPCRTPGDPLETAQEERARYRSGRRHAFVLMG